MEQIGKIYPKETMVFRRNIDTVTDRRSGLEYELGICEMPFPCIRSEKTGKFYIFNWELFIDAAQEAGIDKEDSEEQP